MDVDYDAPMSRLSPIAWIALIQVNLVLLMALGARMALKVCGYPDDPSVRWNPYTVWLRNNGWILLAVPLLWGMLALWADRKDVPPLRSRVAVLLGAVLIGGLVIGGIIACAKPYSRPIWFMRS